MYALIKNLRATWSLAAQTLKRIETGGDWALQLPDQVRRNLVHFFYDGFFSSAGDNIYATYLSVYILALGATQAQIGLMSSLSSLTAAIMLLPGALLVERIGRRKELTVLFGGVLCRLMVLLLALIPLLFNGSVLIAVAIALAVCRDMFSNLAYPAWISITGDIIPLEGRGRFFASRNFAMGFAGIVVILLAGLFLSRAAQPAGYQIALIFAFVLGLGATYHFWRIKDPNPRAVRPPVGEGSPNKGLLVAVRELKNHPAFLSYLGVTILWNLSLNIAGPFFNVYMVQNLNATAADIGITTIASTTATMLIQRKVGEWNDRFGARKLMVISSLLIPIVPALWLFITAPWHIIPINILSGALWGVYNLASFNYLLALTPNAQRARYSAIFQITVTVSMAAGAALGSLVTTHIGILAVFGFSALGRLISAIIFARTPSPQEAKTTETAAPA